jgi:hypothetical protein
MIASGGASAKNRHKRVKDMENKALDNNEKILLLGILHYVAAIALIILKIIPIDSLLDYIGLTEQTYAVLLVDSIVMGTILYALSSSLQKISG